MQFFHSAKIIAKKHIGCASSQIRKQKTCKIDVEPKGNSQKIKPDENIQKGNEYMLIDFPTSIQWLYVQKGKILK